MEGKAKTKKRLPLFWRIVIIILSVLLVIFIGLAVTYFVMTAEGEKSLLGKDKTPVMEPRTENIEGEVDYQIVDEKTVRYNGKTYTYNEDTVNVLILGIDSQKTVEDAKVEYNQADVLIIASMDMDAKTVKFINIPRDTMTDVKLYNDAGVYTGIEKRQIALSYAYLDGGKMSCENTVEAVSNLFYGLPIHGYVSVHMNCIPQINDAVGGVTVTVPEDLSMFDERLTKGATVHLDGKLAMTFVQSRMELEDSSNDFRNERQKMYLREFIPTAVEAVKADLTLPVTLLNALSDYTVCGLSASEIAYLCSEAVKMDINADVINLKGESQTDGLYSEKYLDETALYELVLGCFYSEK